MPQSDDTYPIEYITPDQPGGILGWREGIPVIRLFTCGLLSIEILQEVPGGDVAQARYEALSAERLRGAGPAPACHLLKLLVSQPERYAPKDWLLTHLREGKSEQECITPRRLENIVSSLRKLVCLPSGKRLQDLLTYERATHESGDGYQLVGYPLVWLDADALAWNVKQACLNERFGDDPFPYWQRAYELASRGIFLLDEPNSEWAKKRRREVQDHLRQSVHALARLYLSRFGEAAEEEVLRLLSTYRRSHPGDEDLLRPLLHLLAKRGRYGEVLEHYEALERGLAVRGLTKDGKERTPHQLTQEIVDYARLKLREGRHMSSPVEAIKAPLQDMSNLMTYLESRPMQREPRVSFFTSDQIFSAGSGVGMGASIAQMITEIDDWIGHAAFCQDLQPVLTQKIRMAALQSRQPSEQESLLTTLAALPQAIFTSFQQKRRPEIQIEAFLPRCAASITACWFLMNTSDLVLVEQNLLAYLPMLETLAQQYSRYQLVAAHLASQGCMLRAILSLHQLALAEREHYCRQAIRYSDTSGDHRLQAGARMYLGYTHCYRGKPEEAILTFLQALHYLGKLQSLLRSDIYMALAYAYGQCKQEQEAHNALTLAQNYFPTFPEHDPSYLYASCGLSALSIWEGRTYLALGEHYPDQGYYQKACVNADRFTSRLKIGQADETNSKGQ
jgi:tetratricopeptide (TPR) repeat protein